MNTSPPKDDLVRRLGLFSVTNIVVANMIGAGIFTTSGLLMQGLHDPRIMIALWLVGGIVALCGALCYAELGAAIPRAGGEYVFLSQLFHPLLGFLSGWVSLFGGFSAPIAASAIGCTEYLARAFPGILNLGLFDASVETVALKKFYAIVAIVIFALVHRRGLEFGARVQNFLTLLKVGLIVGLILAGFSLGKGSMAHFSEAGDFRFDFGGWKTIGLSLLWIMFAYSGWNAATYIGSEIKQPGRNLPRSLILGTGIVMLLYFCLNLFYIYAVRPKEMSGVIPIGAVAVANSLGPVFESFLSLLIFFALFASLSAFFILGPRVYYSMARDLCFFRFASQVHPKYGVPSKSIALQGVIASIMVLSGTFDQILTYMGFSLGIFPILAICGVFRLRQRNMVAFQMPGFPVVPAVYLLTGACILVFAFLERPAESLIAILTVLVGIPLYLLFTLKYRNKDVAP